MMSRPARSWSETTIACASVNCSRYQGSIIAVSSGRPHMFIVYQRGRGQDAVAVRVVDVEALAPVVRAADDRDRGRRTEARAERLQPLVLGVEVVCDEA